MSVPVPADKIEGIVGAKRHPMIHQARAVSAEECVYVLHSEWCLDVYADLTDCPYSLALDRGIDPDEWAKDKAVSVRINRGGRLVPYDPKEMS